MAALDNLAMGAFAAHDYDTSGLAVTALRDVGQAVAADAGIPKERKEGYMRPLMERLENMGVRTLPDPTAPLAVLTALGRMGAKAAEQKLEGSARRAAYALGRVRVRAAEGKLSYAAKQAASSLGQVGARAAEHGLGVAARLAVQSLCRLGAHAHRLSKPNSILLGRVGTALRRLEDAWGEAAVKNALEVMPGPEASAFREWYQRFKRSG